MKPSDNSNLNIARIPTSWSDKRRNFFRIWLELMRPMHKLTSKEIEVLAAFLQKRLELSKSIIDNNILDQTLLGTEIRKQIREELNLSATHFHVIVTKLKKAGIIVNNRINKRYIPNIKGDTESYKLVFLFEFEKDA